MNISPGKVADIAWADAEILPKMSGMQLWLSAAALVTARKRLDAFMPFLTSNKVVSALGIVDSNGNIDVDTAASAAKEVTRKYGALTLDIPVIGEVRLSEGDFDSLKKYIGG